MSKDLLRGVLALPLLLLLSGCISFEYDGRSGGEPTSEVQLYRKAADIKRPFEVLGTATVSADYTDVSQDRMIAKLKNEAAEYGADAVLIVAQQVIPYQQRNADPRFNTTSDLDNESSSWSQIYKDVDLTYGSMRGTPNDNSTVTSYNRIIRAEFLKFTPEGETPQTQQQKTAESEAEAI